MMTVTPQARKAADLTSSDVSYSRKRDRTSRTRYKEPNQKARRRSSIKPTPIMMAARIKAARFVVTVKRNSPLLMFALAPDNKELAQRIPPASNTPAVSNGWVCLAPPHINNENAIESEKNKIAHNDRIGPNSNASHRSWKDQTYVVTANSPNPNPPTMFANSIRHCDERCSSPRVDINIPPAAIVNSNCLPLP